MQRFNSKGSVGSVGSYRGGQKKANPTHMIVQSEVNHEMLMLPVTHLVNAAAVRLKQNDKATFKMDIHGRKQERGIILLLGKCSWFFFMRRICVFQGQKMFVPNNWKFSTMMLERHQIQ